MATRLTTEGFIQRAREKHGDRYDYGKTIYVKSDQKVIITCKEHGDFYQDINKHLRGCGCRRCGAAITREKRKVTTEAFIQRAREIHGDKYNYEKVSFERIDEKITITCKRHGDFSQIVNNHLKGRGCKACGDESRSLGTKEFIEKARGIHGNTYGYDKVIYKTQRDNVTLICKIHGEFEQAAGNHQTGMGCPHCARIRVSESHLSTTKEFIIKAKETHGDRYDYSKTRYRDTRSDVTIICGRHGEFIQKPMNHLLGAGCQKCGGLMSNTEDVIASFLSNFTEVKNKDRTLLKGKEIDILLENEKLAIEYNGTIWHSERFHKDPVGHMKKKQTECMEKGYRMIHISDKEDITTVKKTLIHILGLDTEKYQARKCKIATGKASDQIFTKFFERNHLQGPVKAGWAGALTINNQIVCAMIFSPATSIRGNTDPGLWELRRFASACRVVGGASRLLRLFIRTHPECREIVSYSDNRWFTGGMYEKLGFTMTKELSPDYKYFKGKITEPKNHFRRSELAKRPGFDFNPEESEHENCKRNGWYRIYDCGKKRWTLKVENPQQDKSC